MGFNYIKYNGLGLLESAELSPISKGNNYVDTFYFYFENSDFTNAYLTFTATLPNGNTLPSATTTPTQYWEGATLRNVYMMKLSNAYTSIAGTMTFTLALKKNGTNELLCSAQLTLTINDTDVSVPTTITETEKGQIQQAIADAVRDLDNRKVGVDFSIYGEATDIENSKVIFSNNGNAYQYPAKNVVNQVYSVNGEIGDVVLTSTEITHNGTNVGEELEKKSNKNEVCFYRDGELIPSELKAKGLIPLTFGATLDGKGGLITLENGAFELGDLVAFDVEFYNGATLLQRLSFIRLLNGDFSEYRNVNHDNGIFEELINGYVVGNELSIYWNTTDSLERIELKNVSVFRW